MEKRRTNKNKKREIIDKYNLTSHFYDKRYSKIQRSKFEYILKDYIIEDKIILDAGCGTGLFFDYIFDTIEQLQFQSYSYVAIDISIAMLKIFQRKLENKEKHINNKIHLILADLENLPIRQDVFHSDFSNTSLQNLPNIIIGIKESIRVVKNKADINYSILKKKVNVEEIISFLNPFVENLKIINETSIEDVIIQANVVKI